MVKLTQVVASDWEDDDDDDYDDDALWARMEKEGVAYAKNLIPPNWILIKISQYTSDILKSSEDWCRENVEHEWKRIGWSAECSTRVGIGFSDRADAAIFILAIGGEQL